MRRWRTASSEEAVLDEAGLEEAERKYQEVKRALRRWVR